MKSIISNHSDKIYKFPNIDEKSMLLYGKAQFSAKNQIYFSRHNPDLMIDRTFSEPRFVKVQDLPIQKKIKQPLVDIKANSPKLSFLSPDEVNDIYQNKNEQYIASFALHFGMFFLFFVFSYLFAYKTPSNEVVEVTFGITPDLVQNKLPPPVDQEVGETEATKTIRSLPQLTKNIAPDTTTKPASQPEKKAPEVSPKNKDLVFKDNTKKIDTKNNKTALLKENEKKPLGPEPPKDKQKIKLEEYLKRKEADSRVQDKRKLEGIRQANKDKPEGQKKDLQALPNSPFANENNIPDSPFAQAPTGDLIGKVNKTNFDRYKNYLKTELKKNWITSEGINFSAKLNTLVEVTVNQYGYLIEKKVIKSSGNIKFDEFVLNSVDVTFPVKQAPPKDIKPPRKFHVTFNAKDIN